MIGYPQFVASGEHDPMPGNMIQHQHTSCDQGLVVNSDQDVAFLLANVNTTSAAQSQPSAPEEVMLNMPESGPFICSYINNQGQQVNITLVNPDEAMNTIDDIDELLGAGASGGQVVNTTPGPDVSRSLVRQWSGLDENECHDYPETETEAPAANQGGALSITRGKGVKRLQGKRLSNKTEAEMERDQKAVNKCRVGIRSEFQGLTAKDNENTKEMDQLMSDITKIIIQRRGMLGHSDPLAPVDLKIGYFESELEKKRRVVRDMDDGMARARLEGKMRTKGKAYCNALEQVVKYQVSFIDQLKIIKEKQLNMFNKIHNRKFSC